MKFEVVVVVVSVVLENKKPERKRQSLISLFSLLSLPLSLFQTAAAIPPLCAAIRSSSSLVTMGEVLPLPEPPKKPKNEEEDASEPPPPILLPTAPPVTVLATAESMPPSPTAEVETCAPRRIGGC